MFKSTHMLHKILVLELFIRLLTLVLMIYGWFSYLLTYVIIIGKYFIYLIKYYFISVCKAAGIVAEDTPPVCPVDAKGRFVAPVNDFVGQYVKVCEP